MDKMNEMLAKAYAKAVTTIWAIRDEEHGAVDIVAIVVMIGIAVVLAIAFKGAITKVLDTLMKNISSEAGKATSSVALG